MKLTPEENPLLLTQVELMDIDVGDSLPVLASCGITFNDMFPYLMAVAKAQLAKCQDVCPECNGTGESGVKIAGIPIDCRACQGTGKKQDPELRELLAELEHEQWMKWSKAIANNRAEIYITGSKLAKWMDCWKPYEQLTEEQKDQDRVWADKCLALIGDVTKRKWNHNLTNSKMLFSDKVFKKNGAD